MYIQVKNGMVMPADPGDYDWWQGPVTDEINHWRNRALTAEGKLVQYEKQEKKK
jgi:hypothetical protein